jgi:hypothetical protein
MLAILEDLGVAGTVSKTHLLRTILSWSRISKWFETCIEF